LILLGILLVFYFIIRVITLYFTPILLVLCLLGFLGCLFVYISIVSNYEIFNKCRGKRTRISTVLCFTLANKIRERRIHEKFKNWSFLINLILAVIVTVMTHRVFPNDTTGVYIPEPMKYDDAKNYMTYYNFFFWLVILFEIVLGCFKLSILLFSCLLCCPCLIYLFLKAQ
jgi:hypothetical protein